jgi:hypothetical protein
LLEWVHMRTLWFLALAAVAFVAASSAASAQNAPTPRASAGPRPAHNATFPLIMAYHAIGRAEIAGATGHYIDAAKTHYRSAIARNGNGDAAGAAGEAMLASDLARAAMDEHPRPAPVLPKDIPAPPSPAAGAFHGGPGGMGHGPMAAGPGGGPGMGGPGMGGPGMMGGHGMMGGDGMMAHHGMMGRHGFGGMRRHEEFNATRLAELLKVETGAEAHQIAQAAVDANEAAQRAALAGNVELAARQTRVSGDLAAAVRDLAITNHPELARRRAPGRMGPPRMGPPPGAPKPG